VINHLAADGRDEVEPPSEDKRGWEKVMTLLAPAFRKELERGWHLRNARKFPKSGLVRACSDQLAVQFDGGERAMTAGLDEIIDFLGPGPPP
jgi:hypothetical protein